jgi:hypothetical protein
MSIIGHCAAYGHVFDDVAACGSRYQCLLAHLMSKRHGFFCEIPLEELMSRVEALPPTEVNLQVPTYPLLFRLRTIIPRSSSKGVNHIVVAWRGSACAGVHGRVVGGTRRGRHPTSGLGGDVTTPAP